MRASEPITVSAPGPQRITFVVRADPRTGKLFPATRAGKDGKLIPSRMQMLYDWLGPDFDGVIVFDESHLAGNAMDIRVERGVKRARLRSEITVAMPTSGDQSFG